MKNVTYGTAKSTILYEVGKLISHNKRGFKLKRDAINYESSFRCEQYEKQEIPVPEVPIVIPEPVKELLFQDFFVKYNNAPVSGG